MNEEQQTQGQPVNAEQLVGQGPDAQPDTNSVNTPDSKGAEHQNEAVTANGLPVGQSNDRIPPAFEDKSQKQYADMKQKEEDDRQQRAGKQTDHPGAGAE